MDNSPLISVELNFVWNLAFVVRDPFKTGNMGFCAQGPPLILLMSLKVGVLSLLDYCLIGFFSGKLYLVSICLDFENYVRKYCVPSIKPID